MGRPAPFPVTKKGVWERDRYGLCLCAPDIDRSPLLTPRQVNHGLSRARNPTNTNVWARPRTKRRPGQLGLRVWVCSDTPILIDGYWYEIVSNMDMKQVVLCCYLLLYSRFGLGWCVWVTSPCWCVLRVHPCIAVEKEVNIKYLLLPGEVAEYTHLVT